MSRDSGKQVPPLWRAWPRLDQASPHVVDLTSDQSAISRRASDRIPEPEADPTTPVLVKIEPLTNSLAARTSKKLPQTPARDFVVPIVRDLRLVAGDDRESVRGGGELDG